MAVAAAAVGIALAAGLAVPAIAGATAPDDKSATTAKDPKKYAGGSPRFASVEDATIVPGVRVVTPPVEGGLGCTSNYVFTGGNRVFLGTAAHCVQQLETAGGSGVNGCERPSQPLGTRVAIDRLDGEVTEGTLAYSAWRTMQARGETDQSLCEFNDFALIEIDPADVGLVNPTVPILGGPTALDTDGTTPAEMVLAYAPNILPDTPVKRGISAGSDTPLVLGTEVIPSDGRVHLVKTVPDGVPGDSGSPYLDAEGDAIGVLSFGLIEPGTGTVLLNGVTDLAKALVYANEFGNLGEVALVPGTEPFSTDGLPLLNLPALPDFPDLAGRDVTIRGMF